MSWSLEEIEFLSLKYQEQNPYCSYVNVFTFTE